MRDRKIGRNEVETYFLISNPVLTTLLVNTFCENLTKIGIHNFLCRKTRIIFTSLFKIVLDYALDLFARITVFPDDL